MISLQFHGMHGIPWNLEFHVVHVPWVRDNFKQYMELDGSLGFNSMDFHGIPGIPWTPSTSMAIQEIP